MLGQNFPISEYYREHIVDAETVSRRGRWWTAVLLIAHPKTGRRFIALYRWQLTESGWKVRKRFSLHSKPQALRTTAAVERFLEKLTVS